MPRLMDTIRRYDERKAAVGVENQRLVEMDPVRGLLSGFDLDVDELVDLKPFLVAAAVRASVTGIPAGEILFGQWVDGLMTGLLFAEEAAKAEEAESS